MRRRADQDQPKPSIGQVIQWIVCGVILIVAVETIGTKINGLPGIFRFLLHCIGAGMIVVGAVMALRRGPAGSKVLSPVHKSEVGGTRKLEDPN
ncbi:hypothetical protein [Devosia sp. LjRoot3]|uniref:hypothetical protein n=1 Tax=Devosia sp. LjRoot3 TaxID=3342319 RepID=UPI003ECD36D8